MEELSEIINKLWEDKNIDKLIKYRNNNLDEFYKYLAPKLSYFDLVNFWSLFSNDWRLIQNNLTSGKICPKCGRIFYRKFGEHIYYCLNWTKQDYADNYTQVPREYRYCPVCMSPINFGTKDPWTYNTFCNGHNKSYIPIENGLKLGWSIDEINAHNDWVKNVGISIGKSNYEKYGSFWSIYNITEDQKKNLCNLFNVSESDFELIMNSRKNWMSDRSKSTLKIYGNPWEVYNLTEDQAIARGYRGLSDPDLRKNLNSVYDIHRKTGLNNVRMYGNLLNGYGFKSIVKYNNLELKLDSQDELWTLLYIIFCTNFEIIDSQHLYENTTSEYDGVSACADIRIRIGDSMVNLEIHDETDTYNIDRKKYCTELNGDKFLLINLNKSCNYFYILDNLGYNVWDLYRELVKSNRVDKKPYLITIYKNSKNLIN